MGIHPASEMGESPFSFSILEITQNCLEQNVFYSEYEGKPDGDVGKES